MLHSQFLFQLLPRWSGDGFFYTQLTDNWAFFVFFKGCITDQGLCKRGIHPRVFRVIPGRVRALRPL